MTELLDVRDNKGRFTAGNKASPGRTPRVGEAAYLLVMKNACSLDDWRKITERAVKDALKGDVKAREWLARYLIGNPETTLQAIQVNNYQTDNGEVSESAVQTFAQIMASVASALSETQRAEFNQHMLALTELVTPPESQDAEPYTVDEHGVVSFADQIKPYVNV